MILEYKPIKKKYIEYAVDYSAVTDQLIKRKRVLLFAGATAQEWLELADAFRLEGGRANVAFCMSEYKKMRGAVVRFETELPQLPDEIYDWQEYTGDD